MKITHIKKVVEQFYKIPDLTIKSRKREVVFARQVAMYFARQYSGLIFHEIGVELGMKNHSTVLHACRTVENLIEVDKAIEKNIKEIKDSLFFEITQKEREHAARSMLINCLRKRLRSSL